MFQEIFMSGRITTTMPSTSTAGPMTKNKSTSPPLPVPALMYPSKTNGVRWTGVATMKTASWPLRARLRSRAMDLVAASYIYISFEKMSI